MAKSTVKRRKYVRSYAGVMSGMAKYAIEPMTRQAAEYARDRCPTDTGELRSSIDWDVQGTVGALWASGKVVTFAGGYQSSQAMLIEYGSRNNKKRSFVRYGANKAMREYRNAFKAGLKEALNEQRA